MDHYEVSAYAKAGKRCQHNLNYWQFGDYLGLGAGAHGKLSFHDRILRQQKYRKPEDYMGRMLGPHPLGAAPNLAAEPSQGGASVSSAHPAVELERVLQADDLCFEYFLNTLRLREGVPSAMFSERTGLNITRVQAALAKATAKGLMSDQPWRHEPTRQGFQFLNDLQMLFLA
jgi:coproporphyrinogen III oxidase-like Fe-S oxidoreductase